MATSNATFVEIKGIITALNANFTYKPRSEQWEFPPQGQTPPPPRTSLHRPQMELDTENVRISFMTKSVTILDGNDINSASGSFPMKRDDIKRLNLTVGDTFALRVSKD